MIAEIVSAGGGAVFFILFVGIVALVAWGSVSAIRGRRGQNSEHADPEQILKGRLALGDIDAEEYYRLRKLIAPDDARHLG